MNNPLISLIVPSYNQGDFIEDTLLSVLKQDYKALELIIVDGASKDHTLEILRKYEKDPRVRWISEPDNGPHAAVNKGLRLARGDFVGVQSSTDTYKPGAIRDAVQEFNSDPLLAFVGGFVEVIDKEGFTTGEVWQFPADKPLMTIEEVLSFENYPGIQASFFRRDLALAVGGLDEELQSCHTIFFLHYMLEALRIGARLRRVPKPWGNFREHPNHRSTRPSIEGLTYGRERNLACKAMAQRYSACLSAQQIRLLRRVGYYYELYYGAVDGREILRVLPALFGYLRFGGKLSGFRTIAFYLLRNISRKGTKLRMVSKELFKRGFPGSYEAAKLLKQSVGIRRRGPEAQKPSKTHVQVDTRWYLGKTHNLTPANGSGSCRAT